jgi:hypothetical protein
MTRLRPCECLPASYDYVDVKGVDFKPVTTTPGALPRNHGGAATEKAVQHQSAARGTVDDGVGDHSDRLYRRMQREQIALITRASKSGGAGVGPDVGSIASVLSELDVVAVHSPSELIDEDELVLTAIEGAHPGVVLGPDADVFELRVNAGCGRKEFCHVAPVYADVMQRAVDTVAAEQGTSVIEKQREFRLGHLARGHLELAMSNRSEAAYVAVDRTLYGGSLKTISAREESDEPDSKLQEAAPAEPLVQRLLGKREGETFLLAEGRLSGVDRHGIIRRIVSKFVFRYQQLLDQWSIRYQSGEIEAVHISTGSRPEDFEVGAILHAVERKKEATKEVESAYTSQPVAIHEVARALGLNDFDAQAGLLAKDQLSVRCAEGSAIEIEAALSAIRTCTGLVLDFTALGTLIFLDRLESLRKAPVPILVISLDRNGPV